jgi:hypothetical protein
MREIAMIRAGLTRWVQAPPVTGSLALLCGFAAVGLPTAVRAAIDGIVTGCEFTPYLPFVLLSAILMRWWHAGVVALLSVAILGGLSFGPMVDPHGLACFASGAAIFLASSAVMIGIVVFARRVFGSMLNRGADESPGGIVFSLDDGKVWASWYGQGPPVLLGSQKKVSGMMGDFLAQEAVGKRLTRKPL